MIPLTNDDVRAVVGNLAIGVDSMHMHVTHRVQTMRAVRSSGGILDTSPGLITWMISYPGCYSDAGLELGGHPRL